MPDRSPDPDESADSAEPGDRADEPVEARDGADEAGSDEPADGVADRSAPESGRTDDDADTTGAVDATPDSTDAERGTDAAGGGPDADDEDEGGEDGEGEDEAVDGEGEGGEDGEGEDEAVDGEGEDGEDGEDEDEAVDGEDEGGEDGEGEDEAVDGEGEDGEDGEGEDGKEGDFDGSHTVTWDYVGDKSEDETSSSDTPDTAADTDSATDTPADDTDTADTASDGGGLVERSPDADRQTADHGVPTPDDVLQEPDHRVPDDAAVRHPPEDKEMPLTAHIDEMMRRLLVVLFFASVATAIALLWSSEMIDVIWSHVFASPIIDIGEPPRPHVYSPIELWMTRIRVAALAGLMVAIPMIIYQTYQFMRPGLYPHERRYYLAAVPTSAVLAAIGMLFSFFVILPIMFSYFTFYAEGSADIAFALGETFLLIITISGVLAIVFQIPLLMILAVMMGVTTRQWMTDRRLYFWAGFAGFAFLFIAADPTGFAPILILLTEILLFEGTLKLLKVSGR